MTEERIMKAGALVPILGSVAIAAASMAFMQPAAFCDVTSPSIKDKGKKYSREKARSDHYGTGQSGRLVEASELRFQVGDLLDEGDWLRAIPKAKKAVQLDPGDPTGHIYLARALTLKLYQSKGEVDEKLLAECIHEWQLIRYHDADPTEQWEAGNEVKKLSKIAKALAKQKKEQEKEKERLQLAKQEAAERRAKLAESRERLSDGSAGTKPSTRVKVSETISKDEEDTEPANGKQVAEKKKRFGLF